MSHIEDFQHSTFNFQRYEKKRFGEEVFPGKKRQERRPEVAQLDYELSRPCGCAANDGTAVCLYQRLHCWASEIDYGISRWSITLCSYELRIPGSYVITIGCSYGIRTGCSYDIRILGSSDLRTGCSYDIKTSIIDELRVMNRYEHLWAIGIFICCTFAPWNKKHCLTF